MLVTVKIRGYMLRIMVSMQIGPSLHTQVQLRSHIMMGFKWHPNVLQVLQLERINLLLQPWVARVGRRVPQFYARLVWRELALAWR